MVKEEKCVKKYIKFIIILLALIIISTVAYIAVDKSKSTEEEELASEGIVQLCELNSDEITRMVITNSSGTYDFSYTDGSWDWSNEDDKEFICNAHLIAQIASEISNLESTQIIDENPSDLSVYGFDNALSIECDSSDGKAFTLEIGSKNPTSTSYYVKKSDENTVYTISVETGDVIYNERNDLKNNYLIDVMTAEIKSIQLDKKDDTVFRVERNENNVWEISEPVSGVSANITKITTYADLLVRATAYDFIEENPSDLSVYGLDDPAYTIQIESDERNIKVLVGNEPKEYPEGVYVMVESDNQKLMNDVMVFYKGNIGILDADVSELFLPNIYGYNINKVSDINILIEGQEVNLKIDSKNDSYTFNGVNISDDERISLYKEFFNSFNMLEIADVDSKAVPDTSQTPVLEINYTLNDGTEIKTDYYSGENPDYLYYFNNGKYTGTVIDANNATQIKAAYSGILNRVSEENTESSAD